MSFNRGDDDSYRSGGASGGYGDRDRDRGDGQDYGGFGGSGDSGYGGGRTSGGGYGQGSTGGGDFRDDPTLSGGDGGYGGRDNDRGGYGSSATSGHGGGRDNDRGSYGGTEPDNDRGGYGGSSYGGGRDNDRGDSREEHRSGHGGSSTSGYGGGHTGGYGGQTNPNVEKAEELVGEAAEAYKPHHDRAMVGAAPFLERAGEALNEMTGGMYGSAPKDHNKSDEHRSSSHSTGRDNSNSGYGGNSNQSHGQNPSLGEKAKDTQAGDWLDKGIQFAAGKAGYNINESQAEKIGDFIEQALGGKK